MNNIFRVGFSLLGIISLVYGVLGFSGIEVWMRNKGWVELSQTESIVYFSFGIIILLYLIFLHKRKKPKENIT